MSTPKLICKSGYIKDLAHVLNTLEYAGNKIAAQHIVFKDGTVLEVDPEARIALTKAEQEAVSGIRLSYKDGVGKDISYESYSLFTKEKTEAVRVHDLQTVQNDETWLVNSDGKSYHNIEDLDFFKYLPYVAERPGVEKEDGHGLFGLTGNIDIEQAKALATEYENSIKWSHIISLDAQAAADAGFDCRSAWKDLIIAKSPQIAKAYHISLENLVINCAYHGNTDNPHAHLIFYSKSSSEGYIKGGKPQMQVASEALKSMFYNDIFKNDVREIEIEKSKNRDTIKQSLNKYLQNCMAKDYGQTELADMLLDIANEINGLGGTKKYGYMPPEVKTKVDNLFRRVVEHDNDMAAMFEKICGIHRKQIGGYVSNPAVIDEKMKMFRQEFFSPKKDKLRIYHNTILDFAVKINSMALPAAVRTAEEKIFNNKPQMLELSREIFAPADEPEEVPLSCDDDAPLEAFEFIPEWQQEEMTQITDADYGIPVSVRTADEEILEPIPSRAELSSEKLKEKPKTPLEIMNITLKSKNKQFARLYYKALSDIFNPKLENTGLQSYAMEHFIDLQDELCFDAVGLTPEQEKKLRSKVRYSENSKAHIKELFNLIYSTDNVFCDSMNELLEKTRLQLCESLPLPEVKNYFEKLQDNMLSAKFITPVHDYLYYFAETLDDQKYYQLLSAYQEFNKPLNKSLYHALIALCANENNQALLEGLRKIRHLADELDDDKLNKIVCETVKTIFFQLCEDDVVSADLQEYLANYGVVLDDNFDKAKAKKYKKRLASTLADVPRLMRPHLAVVKFAESLDEHLYNMTIRDKENNKPFYKELFKALDEALADDHTGDDMFTSQLLRQELHQLHDTENRQHSVNILKFLRDTDQLVRHALDNLSGSIYNRLKVNMNSADAGEWLAKYQADLFSAESELPVHFVLNGYAKTLSENYYRQAIRQNRDVFSAVSKNFSMRMRDDWSAMSGNAAYELQRLLNEKEPNTTAIEAETSKLFRQLYDSECEKELENCKSRLLEKLNATCTDPNMLLELDARIDTALYSGESSVPYNFIIQNFCKNLRIEHIKFVCKELKPELKEFRSQLYRRLCTALTGGNPAASALMCQYKASPSAEKMDELLKALSNKDYDFTAEKEKLYQSVFAKLREHGISQPESEYRSSIDKLFYGGGDNPYDTLHMHETIVNVLENSSEIIHKHNVYICTQLTKLLFQSLARLLHGQAENANRYSKDEHSFAAKPQFRNRKQFAERGTLHDNSISY
ncbi:MAG: MobP3 family relaxase [Hydrogenoanaerobacterium sp.]